MPVVLPGRAVVNRPKMTVEVDFVNDPTSTTETWTDITRYVRTRGDSVSLLNSKRGRNYELARTQAGTIVLTLDNTDGRFAPSNTASPYRTGSGNPGGLPGLVTSERRVRVRATWNGVTYGICRGYVEDWPQEWTDSGTFGITTAAGYDALSALAAIDLTSLTVVEVLKRNPLAYYRCNEAAGAVSAGNSSSTNQPMSQIVASSNAQTTDQFAFGSDEGAGALGGDITSSLKFTAPGYVSALNEISHGYALRTADNGVGPLLQIASGCTVEMWIKSTNSTSQGLATLFLQTSKTSDRIQVNLSLFPILVGGVTVYTASIVFNDRSSGVSLVNGTKNVLDGQWHHIVATLAADRVTPALYIDGVASGTPSANSANAGAALVWDKPYMNEWGGDPRSTFKAGSSYFDGNIKNLALYGSALTPADVLALYQSGSSFSGETSGARVHRLLDAAAWPTALRQIDTGNSLVGAQPTEGQKCLASLEEVADTEQGVLFVNASGQVAFTSRQSRFNGTSFATFGEQEFHYSSGTRIQTDPKDVYNDVSGTRPAGVNVRAIDTTSQLRYYPRSLSVATVAVDDASVVYTVQYLLDRYKQPADRIPQIVLDPQGNPSLWPQALGREIGDRITVVRRPGGAPALTADYFIESIEHAVTGNSWKTTWLLSPASFSTVFQLDTAYGRLGGGSTLNAGMTAGQTSLVTPDAVFNATDVPYDVVVDSERMTVTAASTPGTAPQTLTVTRARGGTSAAAHASGAAVTLADSYGMTF